MFAIVKLLPSVSLARADTHLIQLSYLSRYSCVRSLPHSRSIFWCELRLSSGTSTIGLGSVILFDFDLLFAVFSNRQSILSAVSSSIGNSVLCITISRFAHAHWPVSKSATALPWTLPLLTHRSASKYSLGNETNAWMPRDFDTLG